MAISRRSINPRSLFPRIIKKTEESRETVVVSIVTIGICMVMILLWYSGFLGTQVLILILIIIFLVLLQRNTRKTLISQRDWGLTILDTINEAIITTDENGRITFMNPAANRITGWGAEEVVGKRLDTILNIRSQTTNRQLISPHHLVIKKTSEPTIAQLYRRRGKVVHVRQHAAPIKNTRGDVVGSIRILRDISARVAIEMELELRKRAFETLVENAGDIITRHDTKFRYIYVNREIERVTGIPRRTFIGKTFNEVVKNKEIRKTFTKGLAYVYEHKKTYVAEYKMNISNGTQYFHARFVPEFDAAHHLTSVLIISRDITELKQLAERKDEFIAMASHELKTPLTSVKVFAQMLERRFSPDVTARRYFKLMNAQVDRLAHFINDMLDVTKIQAGKLELTMRQFSLPELIQETVDIIRATAPTHHFTFLQQSSITLITGDRERISQVIVNLLNNAVKYAPNTPEIQIAIHGKKDFITITVKDFGMGIPKRDQEKIFERFYRISRGEQNQTGLGMGLYIAYEIVQRHHGSMWVESKPREGTTFFVRLPVTQRPTMA